jgi:4-amino-4-deoxy-L-arabinose transferase-like glycosyltransferase
MLSMSSKYSLWILIAVSTSLRLVGACSLGVGNDEAYHFLYAANPALSYYDHPPMMAWIEMAGLSLPMADASPLRLRIGFILLFAASTWLLARLTGRYYGPAAGFLAAFALNVTGYYGLAASTFALPDGPLLFFWLLAMDRLVLALEEPDPRRLAPWVWVGLAWGGAMLSKYHAVFIPLGAALYVLLHPPARRWLMRPGPYLALVVGLMVFSPVLVWNAQHDWVSFLFQGSRAVGAWTPRPDYLAAAVLAQAVYLFPWIWFQLITILFRNCLGWRSLERAPERLWLCLAGVPLSLFSVVACFRPVLPHWGLIGYASVLPMLGRMWRMRLDAHAWRSGVRFAACAVFSVALLVATIVQFQLGVFQRAREGEWGLVDVRTDPTLDLYGWEQVVDRMRKHKLFDEPSNFVFTRFWYQSAQLAYALNGNFPVLCYNADDPRGFAFWSRPRDWIGRDGVLVAVGDPAGLERYYERWFSRVECVDEFWVQRHGKPVRKIGLYRCTHQRIAYPFALDRAERLAYRTQEIGTPAKPPER